MRTTLLAIAAALGLSVPLAAPAQSASASIRLELPRVLPTLVVISPGVQVVPEMDHEVFFVDGHYWARHERGWYRSKSHRGGWVLVPGRRVPAGLVKLKPGKYKRWKAARAERRHDRDHYDRHGHRDHDDRGRGRRSKGRDDRRGHDRDDEARGPRGRDLWRH